MANKIIKGKIEYYEKSENYDEDGLKVISYWITVNNEKFKVILSKKNSNIYFENDLEVVLYANEINEAIAGLCPKKGFRWGNTQPIKGEIGHIDRFELAEGTVLEKRKESFSVNKGTSASATYDSNSANTVNYTIVLPEKTFRVHENIGKRIKPNTVVIALIENGVGFIIKDITSDKIYGKPRKDYIIALILWVAFNITIIVLNKQMLVSYKTTLLIGNLVFGAAFLFSFTAFVRASKTLKLFNQMLGSKNSPNN